MISNNDRNAFVLVEPAPQASKTPALMQQIVCGHLTQRYDELGSYQLDLPREIWLAAPCLFGHGFTVSRRTTFYDVGDVNVVAARQIDSGQHAIQELACRANEGLPPGILLGSGAFPHVEPLCTLITDSEYRAGA